MISYADHDEHPFHTTDAQRNRAMILEASDYVDVQRRVEADLALIHPLPADQKENP